MEQMKHQDGVAPAAEDTVKLNEIITWLNDHGYRGMLLVHKGDVGISWYHEKNADDTRHTFINALGHIFVENRKAAEDLMLGMVLAVKQIQE